jgi:hypothetical protein
MGDAEHEVAYYRSLTTIAKTDHGRTLGPARGLRKLKVMAQADA